MIGIPKVHIFFLPCATVKFLLEYLLTRKKLKIGLYGPPLRKAVCSMGLDTDVVHGCISECVCSCLILG